jgi:4a-hydroxytetrahydrobiopterin dehydratase
MTLDELLAKHCFEREKGTPVLSPAEVNELLNLVPGWTLAEDGTTIQWQKRMAHFVAAVNFVDKLAEVCEEQDHHPDIHIYKYRWVGLDFTTTSIGGLSENDFIMAAKVNQLAASTGG